MKKKQIEKIPYLKLPKLIRQKDTKYIGVTDIVTIAEEEHLILEIYRNKQKSKNIPLVRIVLTKKDFANYYPEKGEWTRQKIQRDYEYNAGLIWGEQEDGRNRIWTEVCKRNLLYCKDDLERIKKICKSKIWDENRWWEYIHKHEDGITATARIEADKRKYERRQQALEERIKNTPEFNEQEILNRADRVYFHNKHYLYYKKHGCRATIACSNCGGISDGRWKYGITYESQFERGIEEPMEGKHGTCPMCGVIGEYKCQGKAKFGHGKTIHLFLGQKYKKTGMIIRYIEVTKTWNIGFIQGNKGPEMFNAHEELSGVEIARAYFEQGKKTQIDYNKHNPYTGNDFWDDCNLYGLSNITINNAPILGETFSEMKGTIFQYSALKEYSNQVMEINPIKYLERYLQTPQIEMLVKLGLTGVVTELVNFRYGIVTDMTAKSPDKFLGIRKERVKQLIDKKGDITYLETMKMEKNMQKEWTDDQIEHLTETGLRGGQIEVALNHMSMQQLLNQISKYANCEYGTGCTSASDRIKHAATTYIDYLSMRIQLGYDLGNMIYLKPKNLDNEHRKMIMEIDKKEQDKRLLDVKIQFPDIRKKYIGLRKRFFYEDENYTIRPARSAEEIVIEGRILHHCVGGNNYLEKHNDGKSYILFLRKQNEPETPYITVEIGADNNRILQWYGAYDKKPNKANIDNWINEYITKLKSGTLTEDRNITKIAI